jgi:hypothetical protein
MDNLTSRLRSRSNRGDTVKQITQELYHVAKNEKFDLFTASLRNTTPRNALIFTKRGARLSN